MKKILTTLIATIALASASSNVTVRTDPFAQMDKLFQMQMKQMEQMQKQMDEMFKVFEQSNMGSSKMPVIFNSGGMMSSGIKDKGDYYEVALNVGKASKTNVDVKAQNGMLSIKVEQTKEQESKNGNYGVIKSHYVSSYMQAFTLPKDADASKISHEVKDGKIIVKIPKVKK